MHYILFSDDAPSHRYTWHHRPHTAGTNERSYGVALAPYKRPQPGNVFFRMVGHWHAGMYTLVRTEAGGGAASVPLLRVKLTVHHRHVLRLIDSDEFVQLDEDAASELQPVSWLRLQRPLLAADWTQFFVGSVVPRAARYLAELRATPDWWLRNKRSDPLTANEPLLLGVRPNTNDASGASVPADLAELVQRARDLKIPVQTLVNWLTDSQVLGPEGLGIVHAYAKSVVTVKPGGRPDDDRTGLWVSLPSADIPKRVAIASYEVHNVGALDIKRRTIVVQQGQPALEPDVLSFALPAPSPELTTNWYLLPLLRKHSSLRPAEQIQAAALLCPELLFAPLVTGRTNVLVECDSLLLRLGIKPQQMTCPLQSVCLLAFHEATSYGTALPLGPALPPLDSNVESFSVYHDKLVQRMIDSDPSNDAGISVGATQPPVRADDGTPTRIDPRLRTLHGTAWVLDIVLQPRLDAASIEQFIDRALDSAWQYNPLAPAPDTMGACLVFLPTLTLWNKHRAGSASAQVKADFGSNAYDYDKFMVALCYPKFGMSDARLSELHEHMQTKPADLVRSVNDIIGAYRGAVSRRSSITPADVTASYGSAVNSLSQALDVVRTAVLAEKNTYLRNVELERRRRVCLNFVQPPHPLLVYQIGLWLDELLLEPDKRTEIERAVLAHAGETGWGALITSDASGLWTTTEPPTPEDILGVGKVRLRDFIESVAPRRAAAAAVPVSATIGNPIQQDLTVPMGDNERLDDRIVSPVIVATLRREVRFERLARKGSTYRDLLRMAGKIDFDNVYKDQAAFAVAAVLLLMLPDSEFGQFGDSGMVNQSRRTVAYELSVRSQDAKSRLFSAAIGLVASLSTLSKHGVQNYYARLYRSIFVLGKLLPVKDAHYLHDIDQEMRKFVWRLLGDSFVAEFKQRAVKEDVDTVRKWMLDTMVANLADAMPLYNATLSAYRNAVMSTITGYLRAEQDSGVVSASTSAAAATTDKSQYTALQTHASFTAELAKSRHTQVLANRYQEVFFRPDQREAGLLSAAMNTYFAAEPDRQRDQTSLALAIYAQRIEALSSLESAAGNGRQLDANPYPTVWTAYDKKNLLFGRWAPDKLARCAVRMAMHQFEETGPVASTVVASGILERVLWALLNNGDFLRVRRQYGLDLFMREDAPFKHMVPRLYAVGNRLASSGSTRYVMTLERTDALWTELRESAPAIATALDKLHAKTYASRCADARDLWRLVLFGPQNSPSVFYYGYADKDMPVSDVAQLALFVLELELLLDVAIKDIDSDRPLADRQKQERLAVELAEIVRLEKLLAADTARFEQEARDGTLRLLAETEGRDRALRSRTTQLGLRRAQYEADELTAKAPPSLFAKRMDRLSLMHTCAVFCLTYLMPPRAQDALFYQTQHQDGRIMYDYFRGDIVPYVARHVYGLRLSPRPINSEWRRTFAQLASGAPVAADKPLSPWVLKCVESLSTGRLFDASAVAAADDTDLARCERLLFRFDRLAANPYDSETDLIEGKAMCLLRTKATVPLDSGGSRVETVVDASPLEGIDTRPSPSSGVAPDILYSLASTPNSWFSFEPSVDYSFYEWPVGMNCFYRPSVGRQTELRYRYNPTRSEDSQSRKKYAEPGDVLLAMPGAADMTQAQRAAAYDRTEQLLRMEFFVNDSVTLRAINTWMSMCDPSMPMQAGDYSLTEEFGSDTKKLALLGDNDGDDEELGDYANKRRKQFDLQYGLLCARVMAAEQQLLDKLDFTDMTAETQAALPKLVVGHVATVYDMKKELLSKTLLPRITNDDRLVNVLSMHRTANMTPTEANKYQVAEVLSESALYPHPEGRFATATALVDNAERGVTYITEHVRDVLSLLEQRQTAVALRLAELDNIYV